MRTRSWRRSVAKALFWCAGNTQWIRVRTRTYRIVEMFPKLVTEPAGHLWSPVFSTWLLKKSMRWDWDHFDHWATVREGDCYFHCAVCGGMTYVGEDDEELEPVEVASESHLLHTVECASDKHRWEPLPGRYTSLADIGTCSGCDLAFYIEGLVYQDGEPEDYLWCACCAPEGVTFGG